MLGDNLLKLVEPDREDNRVRLRDRLAHGCGGSQRAELCRHPLCMGLVLRGKHNTFAATDQMLRQGAAEVASADDGCRHGFKKLHQMKLSKWSTDMGR